LAGPGKLLLNKARKGPFRRANNYYSSLRTSILHKTIEDGFKETNRSLLSVDDSEHSSSQSEEEQYELSPESMATGWFDDAFIPFARYRSLNPSGAIDPDESSSFNSNFQSEANDMPLKRIEKPKDLPWSFSLFPLKTREKRTIAKTNNWSSLQYCPDGDYIVAPVRLDILDFQRKYWIYRNLSQILVMISDNPSIVRLGELKWMRNTIYKYLGNGTKRHTKEQSSLLSQTFYAFRKHKSSTRRRKALLEQPS